MIKNVIIAFYLFSTPILSQSKAETEKWILDKYNEYESSENRTRELVFDEGKLYYLWILTENYGHWTEIAIKNIEQIKIHHERFNPEDEEGWDEITLYFETGKSRIKDAKPSEDDTYKISEQTSIDIKLSEYFIKEGLKPRMEKALLHLIKAYGGNATIKKDAF
tara:strand:+ start:1794 stop:2285 length:492 start_codon:yes stop_codon:yes gene_type:complete